MNTKHTEGPWQLLPEECDKPYIRIRGTKLGGRYKIANVLTPIHPGVHEDEADETRANARLIAAAPDLLNALVMVLDDSNAMDGRPRTAEVVYAAIAKATGKTK
jgi:hypothetical protein